MDELPRLPTFEHPQTLPGGFRLPTRMTVLPLSDGALALVSPVPIDDERAAALSDLGEVRYLVAPNLLHHLYLASACERYPRAKVLASGALRRKRPDLRVDLALEDPLPEDFERAVVSVRIDGAPAVDEYVFFHRASRTLVATDLVFDVRAPRGLVAHLVLYAVGCHGELAQSRMWRFFVRDRRAAEASVERILGLPFERLVVAHGEGVDEDAHARLATALSWMRAAQSA